MKIPPGQIATNKLPIMTFGSMPQIDMSTWEFKIFGTISKEIILKLSDLQKLPKYEIQSAFHCVTQWSRMNNTWEGILVSKLIESCNIQVFSDNIMVHCYGGYTTNIHYSTLTKHKAILAFKHDKTMLKPEHGGPLRLIVPERYAWKSAKWINGLEFIKENKAGFWESRGYHMEGDPWKQQRFK